MNKSIYILALVFLAAIFSNNQVKAQDSQVSVFPVPAVFLSKNVEENQKFTNALAGNNLTTRKFAIDYFINSFKQKYPYTALDLNDRNKYNTFAAYINIPRVSEYTLNKGDKLTDIYLPLTMSINFVNMATSEILYSYPYTFYTKYETIPEKIIDTTSTDKMIVSLHKENYQNLVDYLINKAISNFKPFKIDASIVGMYKDVYVLNKGSMNGIAKGDCLTDQYNNQISVLFSSLNYSIAQNIIGKPINDSIFTKYSNISINEIKKPKVAFINDLNDEKIYHFFSTAIGANAEFSLITLDKLFYKIQSDIVSASNLKTQNIKNREIPDYFLKINLIGSFYTQYPSNKDYLNIDKYNTIACGNLLDKSGKTVYSKCVDDEIVDKVVSNIRFNNEATEEILIKNTLIKLAEDFSNNIKFNNTEFDIKKVEGKNIYINDPYKLLALGDNLTIFKNVKIDKLQEDVLIPIWEYAVSNKDNNLTELKPLYAMSDNFPLPEKGDKGFILGITNPGNNEKILNFISENLALSGNEVILNDFDKIAFSAISSSIKAPITNINEFQEDLTKLNSGIYGFKRNIDIPNIDSKYKIRPVYKVELLSQKPNDNIVEQKYRITVGIALLENNELLTKKGLQQEVTIFVSEENNNQIINFELLKAIYPLLQKLAIDLQK
ncbi:MAG: hypothetical protein PHC34_02550 [Candidatus Gastranaerophilales bacterium]|nr:hypothetical protein [Candidatus Gastranaerophilales bacterium]